MRESVAGSEFERVQKNVINFAHPRVGSEKICHRPEVRVIVNIIPLYRAGVRRDSESYCHHGYLQVTSTNVKSTE